MLCKCCLNITEFLSSLNTLIKIKITMKKIIVLLTLVFVCTTAFGQREKELKLNEKTNLIEATYYHENGVVSQEGTFNLDRKLHGDWISYNEKGEKISEGTYNNGAKTGKWHFWSDGEL